MNDLEFRRRCYVDPHQQDEALQAYCHASPEAAQWREDLQNFDQKLQKALDIAPPEDFAERILLAQQFEQSHGEKPRRSSAWTQLLAIAASLFLALGLTFKLWLQPGYNSLSEEVFAHVRHEMELLSDRSENVPVATLRGALLMFGGELMSEQQASIKHLKHCEIAGTVGMHMVMRGEKGAVTVFYIPNYQLAQRQSIEDPRFVGELIPAPHGSFALVGEQGEALERFDKTLIQQLKWQA